MGVTADHERDAVSLGGGAQATSSRSSRAGLALIFHQFAVSRGRTAANTASRSTAYGSRRPDEAAGLDGQ